MKECKSCHKKDLSKDDFYTTKSKKGDIYYESICKVCRHDFNNEKRRYLSITKSTMFPSPQKTSLVLSQEDFFNSNIFDKSIGINNWRKDVIKLYI